MPITWKSLALALFALATAGWLGQEDSSAHSKFATDHMAAGSMHRTCNPHDPFASCAGAARPVYPAGGGFTLDELL